MSKQTENQVPNNSENTNSNNSVKLNKKTLYISIGLGITVLIIALSVAIFFAVQRGTSNTISSVKNVASQNNSSFNEATDLFNPSTSLECKTTENGTTETIYFKGGSMASRTSSSNFVLNPEGMYVWEEGQKDGFIYNVKASEFFNSSSSNEMAMMDGIMMNNFLMDQSFVDLKKNCKTTSLEDSIFKVPANVNFKSISSLLNDQNLNYNIPDKYLEGDK